MQHHVLRSIIDDHDQILGTALVEVSGLTIRRVDEWEQTLDVYSRPRDGERRAALVCFHGGGWQCGNTMSMRRVARYLAWRLNLVVVSASYRLVDRARFPTPIRDCANAVRWLRAEANRYDVDPNRIAVSGESAGGYNAAMVALTHRRPELAGGDAINEQSANVQALCVCWGPLDFIARYFGNGGRAGAEGELLGTVYTEDPTLYHRASALSYVDASAPPALFVQGRSDPVVHRQQGELGHAAWRRAGVASRLCLLEKVGHGDIDPHDVPRAWVAQEDFLREEFGLETAPDTCSATSDAA
jgi:acetyl esterase/lipase